MIDTDLSIYGAEVLKDLVVREAEVKSQDGHAYRMKIRPYRTIANVIDGVVITFEDISKRTKVDLELAEKENRLLRAEEFAKMGHWQFLLDDNLLVSSDEFHKIYGYDPKKHRMTLDEGVNACHPDDLENVKSAFDKAIETGMTFNYKHRIVRTDGNVRVIQAKTECEIDTDGKVISMFGIIQDITQLNVTGDKQ